MKLNNELSRDVFLRLFLSTLLHIVALPVLQPLTCYLDLFSRSWANVQTLAITGTGASTGRTSAGYTLSFRPRLTHGVVEN